jgi:hypothetical protein
MPIQGTEPLEEELEWLKYGRQSIQESPKVLDDAAKSFLALGSSLLTVYTGALALFKLNERIFSPEIWALVCAPILLWILCISCLAYVYFPDRYSFHTNSPSDIERVTRDISRKKSKRLKIGSVLFVAALAATSISIVWLSAQPAKETQRDGQTILVIAKENDSMLQNLSDLPQEAGMRALPLVLLSRENQAHFGQTVEKRDAKTTRVFGKE